MATQHNTFRKLALSLALIPLTALAGPGKFTVTGTLKNAPSTKIYLEQVTGKGVIRIDSVQTGPEGTFKFEGKAEEPTVYRVALDPGRLFTIVAAPKQSLEVTADARDLGKRAEVKGSPDSEKLQDFREIWNTYNQQARGSNSQQAAIDLYNKLRRFIRENAGSVTSAYVAANFMDVPSNQAFLDSIAPVLQKKLGKTQYVTQLHEKMQLEKNLAIGGLAPDIKLMGPDGKEVALSSLKGKYVLIDFWASWCGPCRRENPNVVRLYNDYKDKGFTIFSVSLDQDKSRWEQAIQADNLSWPSHVSDLKGWQSSAAQLYRINSIPATVLLDKQGKIIAKNLRGPALEEQLAKLLR